MTMDIKDPNPDDSSVATEVIQNETTQRDPEIILPNTEVKEYTLRFRFQPKNLKANNLVARQHYDLIKLMKENFHEMEIYDNKGNALNFVKQMKTFQEHASRFKLMYLKGNPKKKRKATFVCIHRVRSAFSVNEIRNDSTIYTFLNNNNIKINNHEWDETITRVANLGFFVNIDPGNYRRDQFENDFRNNIKRKSNVVNKQIPKYKCRYSSPFLYFDNSDRKISTKAYNLEVPQEKAKEMIKLIHTTFKNEPCFIFHRTRHVNKNVYANAIRAQNNYLSKSRTVQIKGVTPDAMFYLETKLRTIPGVAQTLQHKDTISEGKYSIMTDIDNFQQVSKIIKENITQWMADIHNNNNITVPSNYPEPSVVFKNNYDEDSGSENTMASYLSTCSSIFTTQNEEFDNAPESTSAPTQAWTKPPSIVVPTVATATSSITEVEVGKKNEIIENLQKQIAALNTQVQQLIQLNNQQQNSQQNITQPNIGNRLAMNNTNTTHTVDPPNIHQQNSSNHNQHQNIELPSGQNPYTFPDPMLDYMIKAITNRMNQQQQLNIPSEIGTIAFMSDHEESTINANDMSFDHKVDEHTKP